MLSIVSGCVHVSTKLDLVRPENNVVGNEVLKNNASNSLVSEDLVFPMVQAPFSVREMLVPQPQKQTLDLLAVGLIESNVDVSSHIDVANETSVSGNSDSVESFAMLESVHVDVPRPPHFKTTASFRMASQVTKAPHFMTTQFKSMDLLAAGMIESSESEADGQLASNEDAALLKTVNPEVEFALIESDRSHASFNDGLYVEDYDWSKDGLSLWAMQEFAAANIDTSGRVNLNSIDVGAYAYLRDEVLPEGVYHPRSMLSQSLIDAGKFRTDEANESVLNPVEKETAVEQFKFGVHLFSEYKPLYPECMNLGLGNITINNNASALMFLDEYSGRIPSYPEPVVVDGPVQPTDFCEPTSWWDLEVVTSTNENAIPIILDVETLVLRTLKNSKYLQGLADLPVIREKATMEAIAEFDTTTFMESRFRKRSEPVGNQLTVGPTGTRRLREDDFSASAGLTRKTTSGANVSVAQQFGLFNNNSTFLDPKRQGNSRLTLNVTQPLLNGSGRAYNTNLIMLAQMDERLAWDEVSEQLQDYLVEVMEAYWQLYLERARLKQRQQSLSRAEHILAELEHRRDIDAVDSQIASARSAVQDRKTELIRSRTLVRNVESRLRALVNDPSLYGPGYEFVPTEFPACDRFNISMGDAMTQALESRSEIDKSIQNVRAAGVRLKVAKSELMPVLDLVLDTYISGLRGENNIGGAFADQFSIGEPSYSAGFRYELPWGNRLAENRHDRRRVEMRQAISQFEFQIEELMSEVEIAVREVDTSYEEMLARHKAMSATRVDLEYFMKRWELLPGDDRSASFLLEDILSAQDRLAAAESNYAQSQISYTMSIVKAKRALGVLMKTERIEAVEQCETGLPRYIFEKDNTAVYEFGDPSIPIYVEENPMTPAQRDLIKEQGGLIDGDSILEGADDSGKLDDLESTDVSPGLVPYSVEPYLPGLNIDAPVRLHWENAIEQERVLMKAAQ